MNASRKPRISTVLRVCAALCAFVWVAGTALCNLDRFCHCMEDDCAGAGHAQSACTPDAGHADTEGEGHEQAAVAHHRDDSTPREGNGCAGGDCTAGARCCSTIQALVVQATPIVIVTPVSQSTLLVPRSCGAREHALSNPARESFRQVKPRDWVFTPEVCLGPALHSLAPPVSA